MRGVVSLLDIQYPDENLLVQMFMDEMFYSWCVIMSGDQTKPATILYGKI